jgi:hypothetical protein
MGLEDTHLDLLQNIEMGIKLVFQDDRNLKDAEVIKALDALISHYRSIASGRAPKEVDLPPTEQLIFDSVTEILQLRDEIIGEEEKPRKRFSSAFKTTSKEGIILACLRKIQKSARFWTKERGQQGYLNYISDFL